MGTRDEAPPALAGTHAELGSEIDAVMTRALAKAPADRYGSCGELVASARAALGLPDVSSPSTCPRPRRARRLMPTGWPVRARAGRGCGGRGAPRRGRRRGTPPRPGRAHRDPAAPRLASSTPASSEIVADIPVGFESSQLPAGEGFVWVLDQKASTLTRIDPASMEVVGRPEAFRQWGTDRPRRWRGIGLGHRQRGAHSRRDRDRTGARQRPRPHCSPDDSDGTFSVLREQSPSQWGSTPSGRSNEARARSRASIRRQAGRSAWRKASGIVVDRRRWRRGMAGGINGVSNLDLATGAELGSTFVDGVLESETTAIAVGTDAVWFTGSSSAKLWQIQSGGRQSSTCSPSEPARARSRSAQVAPSGWRTARTNRVRASSPATTCPRGSSSERPPAASSRPLDGVTSSTTHSAEPPLLVLLGRSSIGW